MAQNKPSISLTILLPDGRGNLRPAPAAPLDLGHQAGRRGRPG